MAMMPGARLSLGPARARGGGSPADLTPALQRLVNEYAAPSVRRVGTAAFVRVDGPVMIDPYWFYDSIECLTHQALSRSIDELAADPTVATIVLDLQCPGWGVEGSSDTLGAIARARRSKRVAAFVHDCAASGGAWMAAACEEISATPTSWFGSIGSLIPLYDYSELFAKAGIEPKFAKDPDGKGGGYPGVPVTDEFLATLQEVVSQHAADFYAFVGAARGIAPEKVRALNAAMLTHRDALAAGLIDRVETLEQFERRVSALPPKTVTTAGQPAPPSNRKDRTMEFKDITIADLKAQRSDLCEALAAEGASAAAREAGKPATYAQLKSAFAGDAEFIVEAQEKALTMEQAHAAYALRLRAQLADAGKRAADTEAKAADLEKKSKGPGKAVEPVSFGAPTPGGGAEHPFMAAVNTLRAADKNLTLHDAMARAQKADPAAHADYVKVEAEKMQARRKAAPR